MKKNIIFIILLLFCNFKLINSEDICKIEVIYFHATERCPACVKIEELSKMIVEDNFAKEMKNGLLSYKSIDFLDSANEHFQEDYKFDVQTLIISKKVNGKEVEWKNLDKIWDLYTNPEKFSRYLESEIRKFLKD